MAELSERGFEQYGGIETKHGHMVQVYESSAASGPHVWIKTARTPETGSRYGMGPEETTAHLDLVQAMKLRAMLDKFIEGVLSRWTDGARIYKEAHREVHGTPPGEPKPEEPGCSFCEHSEERHTTSLPEEGYRDYCTECMGHDGYHSFNQEIRSKAAQGSQERFVDRLRALVPPSVPQDRLEAVAQLLAAMWQIEDVLPPAAVGDRFGDHGQHGFGTPEIEARRPPVGSYVAMVFRVTGYEPDCGETPETASMARLEAVDVDGEFTGWAPKGIGLYSTTDKVIGHPRDVLG